MEIRWNNLIALAMVIAAIVLVVKNPVEIGSFLGSMKAIGPGHTMEEKAMGLVAFGLIGVLIVAVVRIVVRNNERGQK